MLYSKKKIKIYDILFVVGGSETRPSKLAMLSIIIFFLALVRTEKSFASAGKLRGNGIEFIQNKGQLIDDAGKTRPDILYRGDAGGANVYLRKGGISYVMNRMEGADELHEMEEEMEHKGIDAKRIKQVMDSIRSKMLTSIQRVDMEFVGGNIQAAIKEQDCTEGYFNYYLGHCPQGITGVKAYKKITYEKIYQSIDVLFFGGKSEGIEYDFIVHP